MWKEKKEKSGKDTQDDVPGAGSPVVVDTSLGPIPAPGPSISSCGRGRPDGRRESGFRSSSKKACWQA